MHLSDKPCLKLFVETLFGNKKPCSKAYIDVPTDKFNDKEKIVFFYDPFKFGSLYFYWSPYCNLVQCALQCTVYTMSYIECVHNYIVLSWI